MFQGKGTFQGRKTVITWNDGVLTCDDDVMRAIEQKMADNDGEVGPVCGPYTNGKEEHLASPLSCKLLMGDVLEGATFSGRVPRIPRTPPGAVN